MRLNLLLGLIFLPFLLNAQLGGKTTYTFLDLPSSARSTALGGNNITTSDDDILSAFQNPGTLNPAVHQKVAFSQAFQVGGVRFSNFAYGHYLPQLKTSLMLGVQSIQYGDIKETSELGEILGDLNTRETAITFGAAYQYAQRLSLGANIKVVSSTLGDYNSWGIASDFSAFYQDTAKGTSFTFIIRNLGTQFSTYAAGGQRERLPFQMQIGWSKRLKHLPFRFSVVYHHFDKWDILYDDPNKEDPTVFFGDEPTEKGPTAIFFDKFSRHFILSGEFIMGKNGNLRLRMGYDHFLAKEMKIDNYRSFAGFSMGVGIKINRFRIDYGRTNVHLGESLNHLTISTGISEFRKNVVRSF